MSAICDQQTVTSNRSGVFNNRFKSTAAGRFNLRMTQSDWIIEVSPVRFRLKRNEIAQQLR